MATTENGATSYTGVRTVLITPVTATNTGQRTMFLSYLYSIDKLFETPDHPTSNILKSSSIPGSSPQTTYYKMRGYYVAGSTYETYEVVNAPSLPPPSGHTLIDVTIVGVNKV